MLPFYLPLFFKTLIACLIAKPRSTDSWETSPVWSVKSTLSSPCRVCLFHDIFPHKIVIKISQNIVKGFSHKHNHRVIRLKVNNQKFIQRCFNFFKELQFLKNCRIIHTSAETLLLLLLLLLFLLKLLFKESLSALETKKLVNYAKWGD